jgi:hypothetical protein
MNFVIRLSLFFYREIAYDFILIVINRYSKIVQYILYNKNTEVCLKSFRCQEFFGKLRIYGVMLLRVPNKFAGASSLLPSFLRS